MKQRNVKQLETIIQITYPERQKESEVDFEYSIDAGKFSTPRSTKRIVTLTRPVFEGIVLSFDLKSKK